MKPSKHILIALHRFVVGGAETQALHLAEYLQEKGYRVTVGAFGSETGEGLQRFKRAGIEAIHWGFQEKLILNPKKGLLGQIRKYSNLRKIFLKVKTLKIEVIIPFTHPANMIFCEWYKNMGVEKCFWNQRDLGIDFKGIDSEKKNIEKATEIISNSLGGLLFLKSITAKNIKTIYNGIELPKKIIDTSNEKFKVVMIGNLHGHKDHLSILKVWKIVQEIGVNADLLFLGKKSNTFSICWEYVNSNNLQESVHFLGLVDDVGSILIQSDIAVFSSKWEGLPNGILEPMGYNLPVISFYDPWAIECLGENNNCLIPQGNNELFAQKLIELIQNDSLRKVIGKKNQERIASNFSIDKMGQSFINIIESV